MTNWINKLDIPLDIIINKRSSMKCTEFKNGCDNQNIVYCFTCNQWECHCKHECDICHNIPTTNKWVHVYCKCTNLTCFDDICRKKCIECNEYYCKKCVYRYYVKRKTQSSKYICKYCSKTCGKCNNLTYTGLARCKLCKIKICKDCNYSPSICFECLKNTTNKVLEKLNNNIT